MDENKHREAIIGLWKDNFLRYFKNRFNWYYNENPMGSAKTSLQTMHRIRVLACEKITCSLPQSQTTRRNFDLAVLRSSDLASDSTSVGFSSNIKVQ